METERAYRLIDTPESVATIYGVLRRLGIDARHPEYEDYAQEAWIIFYLWCLEANEDVMTPEEIRKIAFTRMYRRLLNQRYREMRKHNTQMMTNGEDEVLSQQAVGEDASQDWELDLYGLQLTPRQRQIVWHLFASHGNQQWVADQLNISRKTVSRELPIIRQLLQQYRQG